MPRWDQLKFALGPQISHSRNLVEKKCWREPSWPKTSDAMQAGAVLLSTVGSLCANVVVAFLNPALFAALQLYRQ